MQNKNKNKKDRKKYKFWTENKKKLSKIYRKLRNKNIR
jgi:hypothetical protein